MLPLEIWYLMFCIVATLIILYTVYKIIWYTFKMLSLKRKLKILQDKFIKVDLVQPFHKIVFGRKGLPNFIISRKGVSYEVSVISSISTHSRWNFEKDGEDCWFEVRKFNNLFYNLYRNSANVPDHAKMYKRETRFSTHYLELSEVDKKFEKQILLLYPQPKTITYAHSTLDYLKSGDKIFNHEILYIEELIKLANV